MAEQLDRDLEKLQQDKLAFVSKITSPNASPDLIFRIIADELYDISRATIVQNHNSTAINARLAQTDKRVGYQNAINGVLIALLLAHLGGLQINVLSILSELLKLIVP